MNFFSAAGLFLLIIGFAAMGASATFFPELTSLWITAWFASILFAGVGEIFRRAQR